MSKFTAQKVERDYLKFVAKTEAKYGVQIDATFNADNEDTLKGVLEGVLEGGVDYCDYDDDCCGVVFPIVSSLSDKNGNRSTVIDLPDGSTWRLDFSEANEELTISAFGSDGLTLIDGVSVDNKKELFQLVEELDLFIPLLPD